MGVLLLAMIVRSLPLFHGAEKPPREPPGFTAEVTDAANPSPQEEQVQQLLKALRQKREANAGNWLDDADKMVNEMEKVALEIRSVRQTKKLLDSGEDKNALALMQESIDKSAHEIAEKIPQVEETLQKRLAKLSPGVQAERCRDLIQRLKSVNEKLRQ